MISHPTFAVDPWRIVERELDLEVLAQTESVFALGNGHLGLRGNLDEGEPVGLPGTYLAGFHELRPLPYAEAGYGYPESGQTVVNVTDGKLIRLMVGDELFDVRYGKLHRHERVLDLRSGILSRLVEWESPAGRLVRITSERLVSFDLRGVAAIRYRVTPLDGAARLAIQSELVANQPLQDQSRDPRAAAALRAPLESELQMDLDTGVLLAHRTRSSGLRLAAAMWHAIDGPEGLSFEARTSADIGHVSIAADAERDESLEVVKLLAYNWSGSRSSDSVRAQVQGAISEARHAGWDGLCELQRAYLDGFWGRSDVEIEGDPALQQAIRFGLFHTLQAGARGEGRAIAAKGLTGPGYDGHAFWDTESFVLPALTYMVPDAARSALQWRHATLPKARDRAGQLRVKGAAFPWRTIDGDECSAYWPAGTAAFHINADIADAVRRYGVATGDTAFMRREGLEVLVETARLFRTLGYHGKDGGFRLDGVTGPDEYSAVADNNVYTNLMAARNLRAAADAAAAEQERADELGVEPDEIDAWRKAADRMVVPFDEHLGVHAQAESFTDHRIWDFEQCTPEQYPLLLHFPYFELYRRQVVKQADLVLALYTCGDYFTDDQKAKAFEYYEPLTVRDSSLSACCQSVVAAETGHLDLAYDYLGEAAFMDLSDLEHNTRDGVHIASLAGAWIAVVAGLGGFRDYGEWPAFSPRIPKPLDRVSFRLLIRGMRLQVEITPREATYRLSAAAPLSRREHASRGGTRAQGGPGSADESGTLAQGGPGSADESGTLAQSGPGPADELKLSHHGEAFTLTTGSERTLAIPPSPDRPRPSQPPGRAPERRAEVLRDRS